VSTCDVLYDFGLAVVAGLVGAVVWEYLVRERRAQRLRRALEPSIGSYRVFTKETGNEKDERVFITGVRENLLAVTMTRLGDDHFGFAQTDIEIDERFLRSGRGLYEHQHPYQRHPTAFGWWDIQIKNADTIYVHTTYATRLVTPNGRESVATLDVQATIWKRDHKSKRPAPAPSH